MLTKEQLNRKRLKVIADYPENDLPVGCIIDFDVESCWLTLNGELVTTKKWIAGLASSYYFSNVVKVDKYPHLFKKLEWWEERSLEDMPEYVKANNNFREMRDNVFYKVISNEFIESDIASTGGISVKINCGSFHASNFYPATLEEYTTYYSSLK